MTNTTSEGFVVVEVDSAGKPTLRMWILRSDVDANIFVCSMYEQSKFKNCSYVVRRANVAEFETK